jgi:parvulin-like peptidyl-prolyl isomerase
MMKRASCVFVSLLAMTCPWPGGTPLMAQNAHAPDRVVARAGNLFISEREFRERFELLPALYRHRKAQLESSKLELLYSLVAEKLLAQEAQDRKLDQDTAFNAAYLELRKLLARDQLYREEITQKVEVSRSEIEHERRNAERLAHVAYLFFDSRAGAQFVRDRIATAADFDRLDVDSSLHGLRDTATVIWSDADPAIEEAAYALSPGDVSPVVATGGGFYILRLIRSLPGTISTQYSPGVFRERLESRIRQRKEQKAMHETMALLLAGTAGYARPEPFRVLAAALITALRAESTATPDTFLTLTRPVLLDVQRICAGHLEDSLVVAGDIRWSVDEVLTRLHMKRFRIERWRLDALPAVLNGELEYWTQQELLAQEGLRRGLDQRPEVERKLLMWRQASLAAAMKRYAEDRVGVSAAEVWEYRHFVDTGLVVPEINLRVLRTATPEEMQSALGAMADGADFASVVRTWSSDSIARATGGETGFFPVTSRPPLGSFAAAMDSGQRYGPVSVPGGELMFEVIGKRSAGGKGDSVSAGPEQDARAELTAMKRQGLLNQFLSQSAMKRGIDVYEDRLRAIAVTPIPMLTYRILGFGGRMFEVPFVDPQIQWLNVEPPQNPVLP